MVKKQFKLGWDKQRGSWNNYFESCQGTRRQRGACHLPLVSLYCCLPLSGQSATNISLVTSLHKYPHLMVFTILMVCSWKTHACTHARTRWLDSCPSLDVHHPPNPALVCNMDVLLTKRDDKLFDVFFLNKIFSNMFIDITDFVYSFWQINSCLTRGINSVTICKHHFTSPVRALIVPKINDSGCHAELVVVVVVGTGCLWKW